MSQVEQLIIDNLDVWTAAIQNKSTAGRGASSKQFLHGIKVLRTLILELAFSGSLVSDSKENADELFDSLHQIRNDLIKRKVIKKTRSEGDVSTSEVRLSIPKTWRWVRLGDVFDVRDGTHDSPKYQAEGYPLVTSKNIYSGQLDLSNVKFISEEDHLKISERSKVDKGDILFAMIGSIGNPVIIDVDPEFSVKNVGLFKYYDPKKSNPRYLQYYLKLAEKWFKEESSGAVQSFVSLGKLRSYPFPLSSLEEQSRIVAKVDELMALCDQLEHQTEDSLSAHQTLVETLLNALLDAAQSRDDSSSKESTFDQAWQRIAEHFDVLFTTEHSIDQLKQTILQLAVMGKLVPQDPNDEPASVLLEKIAAEKERLVKEGKIKKQKPLPEISEEEKPFELPVGWEWCRLPDIGDLARGKSKHRPRNDKVLYVDGNIPLVQTGDVSRANGIIETYTAMYNKIGLAQSRLWPKGTMCITIAANIADTSVLGFDACFPDSVVGYTPFDKEIDVRYFEFFIRTAKSDLEKYAPSTAQKNINLEILSQVLIPFPPKAELSRVVAKVVKLLDLCDNLKECIGESQKTQFHLADAMAEEALN
jgi:type I restriction enzyme S subunit